MDPISNLEQAKALDRVQVSEKPRRKPTAKKPKPSAGAKSAKLEQQRKQPKRKGSDGRRLAFKPLNRLHSKP